MAKKIVIEKEEWKRGENHFKYCEELENGNILVFNEPPFAFPQEEIVKEIKTYSKRVVEFLSTLLTPYAKAWKYDDANFKPFEEKGRRNDLLHVDSFPTRPMHGSRILGFFTNISPIESHHWVTSQGFADLAKNFAGKVPIPYSTGYDLKSRLERKMKRFLRSIGIKIPLRSPYDHFMLCLHNFLKENREFQEKYPKNHWDFPPGSCWIVFTDQVSHAALHEPCALEQMLSVPQKALLCPEKSPICVLERLSGKNLVDPEFLTLSS